jgi:SsrA-binding protein
MKKIVAQNKKARFNYQIKETFEAGIELIGTEVKPLRIGKANIIDAFAEERGGEIFLINAIIDQYEKTDKFKHNPKRPRKLLLHKKEINKLMGKIKNKGTTIIALSIYFNEKNRVKIELGLAEGKKQHDKREAIKERDWDRQKNRVLKNQNI